ncbi:hypothetical protein F4781DRAFT_162605 [Annulohypoxylon bovei var. microspora]|nr:hypothetical protein F4781DRAFT_162605 [Annulohypoxylon bovei var. microspora]
MATTDDSNGLEIADNLIDVETTDTTDQLHNINFRFSPVDIDLISWASTSSVNSIASQVSDSNINDVQQSAKLLLQTLRDGEKELTLKEKRKKNVFLRPFMSLNKPVKDLIHAMQLCSSILLESESGMDAIGFPDIGLRLNVCFQKSSDTIWKSFRITSVKTKMKVMQSKDKKRPRERGFDYEEYSYLISIMTEITEEVRQALREAFAVRDGFLVAACRVIDNLALLSAKKHQIKVMDKYQGNILVERIFI